MFCALIKNNNKFNPSPPNKKKHLKYNLQVKLQKIIIKVIKNNYIF